MTRRHNISTQRGSVFLVLFSAMAVMGILGVSVMNLMKGPLASSVKLTRANSAQAQMIMAAQSTIMSAVSLPGAGDCDGDGYIEPREWRDKGTSPAPTNGGLLPIEIGAAYLKDPWGTQYGYCVWDHGNTRLSAACRNKAVAPNNFRLEGAQKREYPVVSIVSAGPDKKFSTTCRSFPAADVNGNGVLGDTGDLQMIEKTAASDDMIFSYTYEEALGASGGLWVLKSTDANTATIDKGIEAPQAKFTGTSLMTSIGASVMTPADCSGLGTPYYNDPSSGHCYFRTGSNTNWATARSACLAQGAYLANVTSSAENTLILNNLVSGAHVFIGASDMTVEGDWVWMDGEEAGQKFWQGGPVSSGGTVVNGLYNNWAAGAPQNTGATMDYGLLQTSGIWSSVSQTTSLNGICEKANPVAALSVNSGLRLPLPSSMPTCNATNLGVLRRNVSSTGTEMCDGTNWIAMGGAGSAPSIDNLSDGIANYIRNNIFLGKTPGSDTTTGGGNAMISTDYYPNYGLTTGASNTLIGQSSLATLTTGSANTIIGRNSVNQSQTANRTTSLGDNTCSKLGNGAANNDNTCLGRYTLADQVAAETTSAGMYSGSATTGANRNTWLGHNGGYNTTSGADNTAAGGGGLSANTVGSYSTAIGVSALSSVKPGTAGTGMNTGIGYYGGSGITTGLSNVSIGGWSLYFTSAGSYNTSVGFYSSGTLGGAAGNTHNTILGTYALRSATTVQYNTIVGSYAGFSLVASSANNNTIVGRDALRDKNGSTFANVAIGATALKETGAVSNNVAIGKQALTYGKSSGNVAIGYQSQLYSVHGTPVNTAVGSQSLSALNGNYANNTVAGYQSMKNATTTISATAIGYETLLSATSTALPGVTAVGYQVLKASTTAAYNTAVGYQALLAATTGGYNTAVGYKALSALTTGTNNLAIGKDALLGFTTQGTSVAIGASAGSKANNYLIAIGSNALVSNPSVTNASQESVAVGYNAGNAAAAPLQALRGVMVGSRAGETDGMITGAALGYKAGMSSSSANGMTTVAGYQAGMTAGSYTTALGAMALPAAGVDTAAVGYRALGSMTVSGSQYTAIGANAATNARSGTTGVAAGKDALRMVVSGNNNIAVGVSAGPTITSLNNSIAIGYNAKVSASNTVRFGDTNITLIEGKVAFTFPSDRRLKKDITASDLGLDFIMGLKPVSYRLKQGNGRLDYGFLAQDIEKSLDGRETHMITRLNDQMKTYQLRSNDLIAPVVKAIQERQAKIEDLKRQIAELKNNSEVNCGEAAE